VVFGIDAAEIDGKPSRQPRIAIPHEGIEIVAHGMEPALTGPLVDGLVNYVFAERFNAGTLQPFLQCRHVGVAHWPR
jgi:hypothetical protein